MPLVRRASQRNCERALRVEPDRVRRSLSYVLLLAFFTGAIVGMTGGVTQAQSFPGFTLPQVATPNPAALVRQDGLYATAPILLDGVGLFRIAATVTPAPDQLPIAVRASYVQSVLDELIVSVGSGDHATTAYDPKTTIVRVKRAGPEALLEVVDAHHRDPMPVLTVTSVDAKYHQLSVDALAIHWQLRLQGGLQQALLKRQPAVVEHSFDVAIRVGIALVALTALAWFSIVVLRAKIGELEKRVADAERGIEAEQQEVVADQTQTHTRRRRFMARALRAVNPAQRLSLYRSVTGAIVWSLVLVWFLALTWGLALFPQTTALAHQLSLEGYGVAEIWISTGLLNRVLDVVIARISSVWGLTHSRTSEERARQLLRIPTVARALAGFKTFVLIFLALLATLGRIGVPIGSVVTIGGITAIGVSLAAQNFVRDFVNGFLVLFEDQYVVGDYITINGHSGLVEHLNLRMVQLRDAAGNLITIPHSSVTSVVNQSRNWSRVDYRVPVDPAADVTQAIQLVQASIEDLAAHDVWRDAILTSVEWIGVDSLSRDYIVIRASTKTAPLRQFEFRRQLNARVCAAFAQAGISFGAPLVEGA